MKKVLSFLLILTMILSISSHAFAESGTLDEKYGLNTYLNSKKNNVRDLTVKESEKDSKLDGIKLNSEEYLQHLVDNNLKFEVKDTYYKKIYSNKVGLEDVQNTIRINGELYEKTEEIISINTTPITVTYEQGDLRLREVYEASNQDLQSKEAIYENITGSSILVFVTTGISLYNPIVGFISSLVNAIPYSPEEYGWIKVDTRNYYYYTNIWYEVYDIVGFIPMVITETRRTNLKFSEDITNKYTGETAGTEDFYNGLFYEYSMYYGELTRNFDEAEAKYNTGLRNPMIYRYYTGLVIDNSAMLPQ